MTAPDENDLIQWHRLFGLALMDLFAGSPFDVELEKDLSLKQQHLDVVIIKKRRGKFKGKLPDGLDNLAVHNLLTYKSLREPLDDWSLKELTGHYVNYRKQIAEDVMEPEKNFRMYGISTRYPQKLSKEVKLKKVRRGVYEARRATDIIRVIVLRDMPKKKHNAFWHLFSAVEDLVRYGATNHQLKTTDTSSILNQLWDQYELEGITMPYTMEQFRREVKERVLRELTPEDRERVLGSLTTKDRERLLKLMTPEDREHFLRSMIREDREQLLKSLTKEDREWILQSLTKIED